MMLLFDIHRVLVYVSFLSMALPVPDRAAADLADRFASIIDLLRRIAAAQLASNRDVTPLLLLLWGRLHRLKGRFASLVARVAAGTVRPSRPSAKRAERIASRPRLPERYAWLIRLVPEARVCTSQLQHFVTQPDMVALLQAEPRFGRMLRPLCRMMAISPLTVPPPPPQPPPQPPPPAADATPPARASTAATPRAVARSVLPVPARPLDLATPA